MRMRWIFWQILPEAVMKAIDERAVMGAMGGMEAYAFKKQVDAQTEAMVSMAKNPGGGMNSVAGMGMQMAAGMTMAGQMGNMMGGMIQPQGGQQIPNGMAQQTAAPAAGGHRFCSQCGSPVSPNDKFCSNCGAKL